MPVLELPESVHKYIALTHSLSHVYMQGDDLGVGVSNLM